MLANVDPRPPYAADLDHALQTATCYADAYKLHEFRNRSNCHVINVE